jgi:hypothetical protein
VISLLGWLAWINLVLGVFNLLPAAPLDGGRLLYAAVWRQTKNKATANRVAGTSGVVLGAALCLWGLVELSRGQTGDGIYLLMLGFFLVAGANATRGDGSLRVALDSVKVGHAMREVQTGPGWLTVRAFLAGVPPAHRNAVFMLQHSPDQPGSFVGLVEVAELEICPPAELDRLAVTAMAIPTDRVVISSPDENLIDLLNRLGAGRAALVVDGGRSVGAIMPSDMERIIKSRAVTNRPPRQPVP